MPPLRDTKYASTIYGYVYGLNPYLRWCAIFTFGWRSPGLSWCLWLCFLSCFPFFCIPFNMSYVISLNTWIIFVYFKCFVKKLYTCCWFLLLCEWKIATIFNLSESVYKQLDINYRNLFSWRIEQFKVQMISKFWPSPTIFSILSAF